MATITLRSVKGSALTFAEGDANFTNLNNDKVELTTLSVTQNPASGTGTLSYNNTNGVFTYTPPDLTGLGGINNVVEDTTPQLGGNLDAQTFNITNLGTLNTHTIPGGTGTFALTSQLGIQNVVEDTTPQLGGTLDGQANIVQDVKLENYKETVYTGGTTTGTITPDVANGNVQVITLSGNITWNAFGTPEAGQSMTMVIKQPASGGPYSLTSSMIFSGGNKTLSTTASAVDVMTVFYDGTTYYASLGTNFS